MQFLIARNALEMCSVGLLDKLTPITKAVWNKLTKHWKYKFENSMIGAQWTTNAEVMCHIWEQYFALNSQLYGLFTFTIIKLRVQQEIISKLQQRLPLHIMSTWTAEETYYRFSLKIWDRYCPKQPQEKKKPNIHQWWYDKAYLQSLQVIILVLQSSRNKTRKENYNRIAQQLEWHRQAQYSNSWNAFWFNSPFVHRLFILIDPPQIVGKNKP